MILIDPVTTHSDSNTGNDTVPPGITGLDWCHIVSTASFDELQGFLSANLATIGCDLANIRTPAVGSLVTYAGLVQTQADAAIAAGALLGNRRHVIASVFDNQGTSNSLYEPLAI